MTSAPPSTGHCLPRRAAPHRAAEAMTLSGMTSGAPVRSTRTRTDRTSPDEQSRLRATFGAMLRAERVDAGLSRVELAALTGYARSAIAMWETGAWRPSESSTRRLAEAFRPDGTPVDVALLDLRLQRAAGPSLRRWRRTREWSARRREAYAEAARRLDADPPPPTHADRVAAGRTAAALSDPWSPPQ